MQKAIQIELKEKSIEIELKETELQADLQDKKTEFDMSNLISLYDGKEYEGSYEITPKISSQTLQTKGRVMAKDMQVKEIPYFEVSNISNGNTVYIGKELE